MRSMSLGKGSCVAGTLAVILVACDNSPDRPSPPNNPGPGPTQAGLVRLELTGPNSIAPGATGQFSLKAFYTDNSSQDRTTEGTWRTSNSNIIAMSPGGVAVARARGETSVTVSYLGRSTTKSGVLVLPDGTFRVRGAIRDEGLGVNGAQITVSEGDATGLTATSVEGNYALYGVAGDVELTVTKTGFQPLEQRVQITGHQTLNFDLKLSGPRQTPQGNYALRITAANECVNLPDDLRQRAYNAAIVQDGPRLTVTLSGASFFQARATAPMQNTFRGTADSDQLRLQLLTGYYYFYYNNYYPDLVEQLPTGEVVIITGTATLGRTAAGYSGQLNGELVKSTTSGTRRASCKSAQHTFELIGPEK